MRRPMGMVVVARARNPVVMVAVAVAFVAVTGACAVADRLPEAGFVEADSAGVRIVTNSSPSWGADDGWSISESPRVVLGALDGPAEQVLHEIVGVVGLDDGRWVVADGASSELRVFDEQGAYLSTIVRRGEGPGELLQVVGLVGLSSGTLIAQDGRTGFHFFGADGQHLGRSERPPPAEDSARSIRGWLSDREAVVWGYPLPAVGPGESTTLPISILRVGRDAALLNEIAEIPGSTWYGRDGRPPVTVALGGQPMLALGSEAVFVALASGDEIREYTPAGGLRSIWRGAYPPRPVDETARAEYIGSYLAQMEETGAPPAMLTQLEEQLRTSTVFADELPAFTRLLMDADGNLWAREWALPHALPLTQRVPTFDAAESWAVFDPEGRWLGTVETPPRLHVFEVGSDYVVGLYRDELGVEYVHVHDLRK